jgi:F-type H+-transporting ATPase subunit b
VPQLEVSTFVPQLVWLAITFVILYLLMSGIGLPRVGGAIEARRHRVDDDLARAAQLKSEAEAVLAAYQQTQAAVKETTDRMAAEAAERQSQLSQSLARQTAEAERQIAEAKQRALSEMHGIATEVARSVTEKVTGSAADPGNLATAVDRALAERVS